MLLPFVVWLRVAVSAGFRADREGALAPNSEGACRATPTCGADALVPVTEHNIGQNNVPVKEKMQKK